MKNNENNMKEISKFNQYIYFIKLL